MAEERRRAAEAAGNVLEVESPSRPVAFASPRTPSDADATFLPVPRHVRSGPRTPALLGRAPPPRVALLHLDARGVLLRPRGEDGVHDYIVTAVCIVCSKGLNDLQHGCNAVIMALLMLKLPPEDDRVMCMAVL